MKKIAILQSNYIPWKGYFDLIASVDEFILYDDMQFTRRDWRNRNLIKTPQGLVWLTVPVLVKGKYHQRICDTEIDGISWRTSHWKSIEMNYRRASFFNEVAIWLEPIYCNEVQTHISQLNRRLIEAICDYTGINTVIKSSSDFVLVDGKTERLVDICQKTMATHYVSGPSAKDYIVEQLFIDKGVDLSWFDYSNYASYSQLWGEFQHGVSIIDLLFNCGKNSLQYMKYAKK